MTEINNIPKHWQVKNLGEVFKVSSGKGLKINLLQGGNHAVYGGNGINGYHSEYFIENSKLIIGRVGIKCGVTYITKPKSWVTDNALIVDPIISDFDMKFFQLKLGFENLNKLSVSTAQPVISGSKIYEYEISLPPLQEQQLIVSKIEELLSDLENGKQQLLLAQQQLKVYRQSLLKWAFEGKELLNFESLVDTSQNGLSKRTGIKGEEYKVLRLADITNNVIDKSSPRTIVMDENEIEKYKIKTDDLICVRVNGSKDLVGKLIHVSSQNEKDDWAFCDHFIRFRLLPQKAYSKFFHFYFSTVKMRKYIHDNMVTSAGQNTVSQGTIKNAPVPYCSIREQQLIVEELESKQTVCDKIEETIIQSLLQAETLKQSILKKAFSGELVKNHINPLIQ